METEKIVKMTPKDFFLHIAAIATLYISAISLLILWFQYINVLFPDQLEFYRDPFSGAIRFSIASLIIIFPLYLFLTRYLNQDVRRNPEKKNLSIRKWLIYITLFVGGVTVVIDLIVLINTFLGGELTVRFILKVLSILIVIGGGFGYYFYDLKGKWEMELKLAKIIGWIVSLIVVVSVVGGFFIIGSPQKQRDVRLDQQRVGDLSSIQRQITNFWQDKKRLPNNLDELEDPLIGFIVPVDPETQDAYTYRVTGNISFELCATFKEKSISDPKVKARLEFGFTDANWTHGMGEECFERTIDPERFPPLLKELPIRR